MAPEKRLIDANELMEQIRYYDRREQNELWETSDIEYVVAEQPTVDAVEVVHDNAVAIESDIKSQRLLWMSVEALNRAFGFGGERARRFLQTLEEVANEVEELANEHGAEYALAKLMERASKITNMEITPIHEEEMRQARIENQKNGIFFPEDDPGKW